MIPRFIPYWTVSCTNLKFREAVYDLYYIERYLGWKQPAMFDWDDNVLVLQDKDHGEFFAVAHVVPDDWNPSVISFTRYGVPGRYDLYTFDYVPHRNGYGHRVRFFSDTDLSLLAATKMVNRDLNRKAVVALLSTPAAKKYYRDLRCLLDIVAPDCAITKSIGAELVARWKEVQTKWHAKHSAHQT